MEKLRLDLADLEIERLDLAPNISNGGLESLGMGHGAAELSQSCEGGNCGPDQCACSEENSGASCNESECDCDE